MWMTSLNTCRSTNTLIVTEIVQVMLREGQGYLVNADGETMDKVKNATRFHPDGYQYDPRYKRKVGTGTSRRRIWDGWVHLTKHQKFPVGLVERVVDVLKKSGVPHEVIKDNLKEFPVVPMETMGLESREYQDRAVEAGLLNPRGVIRAPTGSGKTAMIARLIAGYQHQAVVVVPTLDLLSQTRDFLQEHLETPDGIGQLGDGVVAPSLVTVATARTMAKVLQVSYESYEFGEYDDKDPTKVNPAELREWVDGVGTLIIDEAHILGAQAIFDVATKMKARNKWGFSASPWRDDGADLMIEGATGKVRYKIGTKELVDDGYLVAPVIKVIDTAGMWIPPAYQKSEYQKAYKTEIVENPIRNQLIVDEANRLDVPTLILVKQVNHGKILESILDGAKFLSGKATSEERDATYSQMRDGDLRIIIATTIADMGLDLPICAALILAGGGKSSTRHLQRIGRIARPYPGKKSALVVSFDDSHVHQWFANHQKKRYAIEKEEWGESAIWI